MNDFCGTESNAPPLFNEAVTTRIRSHTGFFSAPYIERLCHIFVANLSQRTSIKHQITVETTSARCILSNKEYR